MTATISAPPGTSVRIDRITLGHRKSRDTGDVTSLAASIAADGLAHPLVLTTTRRLVSGARRLEACRVLGWTQIPAVTVTGIWEALELIEAELADPRHAKELTVTEALDLDAVLHGLQWWPKAPYGAPRDPGIGGKRQVRIAYAVGMNKQQWVQVRELREATQGYRKVLGTHHPVSRADQALAAELFATIRSKEDIRGAYRRYRNGLGATGDAPSARAPLPSRPRPAPTSYRAPALPAPSVFSRQPPPSSRRSPQRIPATQIQAGLASMHGTVAALLNTCPSGTAVPGAQAEPFATEITKLIRDLSTLRRRLGKGTS